MRDASGRRRWWPGRSRLEIILGAILTQNTAWRNAERALAVLRAEGLLRLEALRAAPRARLETVIRPAGFHRGKARAIRGTLELLETRFGGSFRRMAKAETPVLRARLLEVVGIGPETADSILLYAFGRPIFVVDAYTGRVLRRHRLLGPGAGYEETRRFFEDRLPADPELFNDYHAQLVRVGQLHCRTRPSCAGCPLAPFLPGDGSPAPDPPLRRRVS